MPKDLVTNYGRAILEAWSFARAGAGRADATDLQIVPQISTETRGEIFQILNASGAVVATGAVKFCYAWEQLPGAEKRDVQQCLRIEFRDATGRALAGGRIDCVFPLLPKALPKIKPPHKALD